MSMSASCAFLVALWGEPSHRFLLFFCSSRRSASNLRNGPNVSARRGGAPPPLAVPHALHGQPPVNELPTPTSMQFARDCSMLVTLDKVGNDHHFNGQNRP